MKHKIIAAALLCLPLTAFSANPNVVNGVATFTTNKNIGTKFPVPNSWKKIIINSGVRVTGSFFVKPGSRSTKNLIIEGKDKMTSVIVGAESHDGDGTVTAREKSAVRYSGPGTLTVKKFTSRNAVKFHVWGIGKVVGDNVRLVQPDKEHTSDGFHGGLNKGSKLTNSYIDVHDDATYITETQTMNKVTIVHNKNGSPFQIGWGDKDYSGNARAVIQEATVRSNSTTSYNQGVVSWANNKSSIAKNTVEVEFKKLIRNKVTGSSVDAPMYQFGTPRFQTNKGVLKSWGNGACKWKNSLKRYNGSNSKLEIKNC